MKASRVVSVVSMLGLFAGVSRGETVAEWQFNVEKDLAGGSVIALEAVAAGASKQSTIMLESKVLAGATGISSAWKDFLGKGYLEVAQGAGPNSADKHGLVTRNTLTGQDANDARYETYMGFPGLGSGARGTVYMVVQPASDWKGRLRRGLAGSGLWIGQAQSTWSLTLWARDGVLMLTAGKGEAGTEDLNADGDSADYVSAQSEVTQTWDPAKWYFVGASWQEGAAPVLFVREMAAGGPAASPAGIPGKAAEAKGNTVAKIPAGTTESNNEPIAIGAQWVNHGNAQTRDGGDAKIAYVRIENKFTASTEKMDEVFKSLAAQ